MTEATPRTQPPAELHWGVAYLREDLQDLRNEFRGLHSRMDGHNTSVNTRIDGMDRSLTERIDEVNRSLGERIDEVNRSLGERIDQVNRSLGERIEQVNRSLGERIDSRFTWTVTTMVALAGIIVAVLRR